GCGTRTGSRKPPSSSQSAGTRCHRGAISGRWKFERELPVDWRDQGHISANLVSFCLLRVAFLADSLLRIVHYGTRQTKSPTRPHAGKSKRQARRCREAKKRRGAAPRPQRRTP